jgi:hypothetical protein
MLPIQSAPAPGESLHSWVTRVTTLNGLSATEWPLGRNPTPAQLERTSEFTGRSRSELDAMLVSHYPKQVRGWGPQELGGWRTDRFRWTCEPCSARNGIKLAAWGLAIQPLCPSCHLLLTKSPNEEPVPASWHQEALCARLARRVELSIASKHHRHQLHSLRRLITLVAQTIDSTWPLRGDSIPPEVWQQARLWGRHPTPSPRAAVLLLEATNPFTRSSADTATLISEGWSRLDKQPAQQRPLPTSYLPARPKPPRPRPAPTWQARDHERLRQLRTHLSGVAAATGLAGRHVPGALFTSVDSPWPPAEEWRARQASAFVLHLLLTGGTFGSVHVAASVAALGLPCTPDGALSYPGGVGWGVSGPLAKQLRDAAALLVEEGLIDYQRRRQLFAGRVPLAPHLLRQLAAEAGPRAEMLARGWLWIRFTRSPLTASPHPELSVDDVHAFDSALDPEIRLQLHEAGSAWIDTTNNLPMTTGLASPVTEGQAIA